MFGVELSTPAAAVRENPLFSRAFREGSPSTARKV
jgi:hypothetical protein